jgi:hypothetical protein
LIETSKFTLKKPSKRLLFPMDADAQQGIVPSQLETVLPNCFSKAATDSLKDCDTI